MSASRIHFIIICMTLCPVSYAASKIRENTVRKFFIRLQPELDVIDIDSFVKKDHVLKFQLKCLLNNDTFCDPVGRWLAPRLPFILLDKKCPKCTIIQESKIADALNYVRISKPEIFQALWNRYIQEDEDDDVKQQQEKPLDTKLDKNAEVKKNETIKNT